MRTSRATQEATMNTAKTDQRLARYALRSKLIASILTIAVAALLASRAGAACTDCHNPSGPGPVPPHDETCQDTSCLESCHAKSLPALRHPLTPFPPKTNPPTAPTRTAVCNTCHNKPFAGVYHPYEINVSANSTTVAGMIDLNQACGQCHGGGDRYAMSTGSIDAGSTSLTVIDPTDFMSGNRVSVWDGSAQFASSIVLKVGNVLTLADPNPLAAFIDATVEQNPTNDVAPYFSKANLALLADGMHGDKPYVTFNYGYVAPGTNRKNVQFDASGSTCKDATGYITACTSYAWAFGDGATGTGVKPTHLYALGGSYTVSLTVTGPDLATTTATRTVLTFETYGIDPPPVVSGDDVTIGCSNILASGDLNTWTGAITDASIDNNPLTNVPATCSKPEYSDATPCKANGGTWTTTGYVSVKWGDSAPTSVGAAGDVLTHTYSVSPIPSCAGSDGKRLLFIPSTTTAVTDSTTCTLAGGSWGNYYFVLHTAVDSIGQRSAKACAVEILPFTVSGTAYLNDTSTPLGGASLYLKSGAAILKTVTSAGTTGAFTFTGVKPGNTYTLTASKTGVTFPAAVGVPPVGPDRSGIVIVGTTP